MIIFSVTWCFIYIFIANSQRCMSADTSEQKELSNLTRSEKSEFIFLYPRTFLSGKNETVCLVIESKMFPINATIQLRIKSKRYYFPHELHSETKCFKLLVPLLRTLEVVKADLSIDLESKHEKIHGSDFESLWIYPATDVVFLETDRYIYKPGENVKIRILILTQDMQPNTQPIDVKIINPDGFIVTTWKNATPQRGIIHLDYQLASHTSLGTWNIECNTYRKTFVVKDYVLPRFKIHANIPKFIYASAPHLNFQICARYTYGNPLRGIALAKLTSSHDPKFASSKLLPLLDNGCAQMNFSNNNFPNLESSEVVHIFVTVTEDGTNQMETENYNINVQKKLFDLRFLNEEYFQPGLPYRNKLKIVRGLLDSYIDEYVEICFQVGWKNDWNLKPLECTTFGFDKEGVIPFSILPFKENVKKVQITASSLNHTNIIAKPLILNRWYSSSASYLKIERNSKLYTKCKAPQLFTVYFTTNKLKHNDKVIFYYVITSTNDIQVLKQHRHLVHKHFTNFYSEIGNTLQTTGNYTRHGNYVDKFTIKLKMHEKIYSKGQLLVFYLNKGEAISNSMNLFVEKCLPINVTANWTTNNLLPGALAEINLKATPNSMCAITTVDIANYFLDSNRHMNLNKILQPFLIRREKRILKQNCVYPTQTKKAISAIDSSKFCNCSSNYDTFEDFNNVGIAVISNAEVILKPCKTSEEFVAPYYQFITDEDSDLSADNSQSIRSYFPSTWHWDLLDTNSSGILSFQSKAPHSITTWNTNIICTSKEGIGVANLQLKTQKLFFIDYTGPSSLKRFEVFHLRITAFNYYNYSLPIKFSLITSIEQINNGRIGETICISPRTSFTTTLRLRANHLGEISITVKGQIDNERNDCAGSYYLDDIGDIVEKRTRVVSQGYPEINSKSILLCGLGEEHNLSWSFNLPDDYVTGSESITVNLYSDMMGPVMHNLEELILLPTGCGEQIMAVMAPNFYVLKYLKSVNNLQPYLRRRIFKNLQIGYQKILDYLHADGSFSAFGYHDPEGSMFLTAFVTRSLSAAKEFIFIDERVINSALEWIMKHQLENGCFASVSHVFQDMGGASLENSTSALTSYVMISLLESKQIIPEKVRLNAVFCIRGQFNPDLYSLAINTYALYLLGVDSEANHGLYLLLEQANKKNNLMWWNCTKDSKSMDIETTSYVLMSLLHKITNDNLIHANAIVRWLLDQRNSKGGFTSSQDTVVALDGISRYALIMNDRNPEMNITILNKEKTYKTMFKKSDPLKMEQIDFPNEYQRLNLSIKGTGCVLTQFLLLYNLDNPRENKAFELSMATINQSNNCDTSTLNPCFAYKESNESTMIVMEVLLPSGYNLEASFLKNLFESQKYIKKIEEVSDKVIFYFTNVNSREICLPFNITRSAMVTKLLNTSVSLYEYYNPNRQVIQIYNLPNECISNNSYV